MTYTGSRPRRMTVNGICESLNTLTQVWQRNPQSVLAQLDIVHLLGEWDQGMQTRLRIRTQWEFGAGSAELRQSFVDFAALCTGDRHNFPSEVQVDKQHYLVEHLAYILAEIFVRPYSHLYISEDHVIGGGIADGIDNKESSLCRRSNHMHSQWTLDHYLSIYHVALCIEQHRNV